MSAPHNPAATLDEVDRIRMRTRLELQSSWYPMVLFGAAALGAAAISGLAERWVGVYWLAAMVGCFMATRRYYRARALRRGIDAVGRSYAAVWIGFVVALIVAGSVANGLGGARAALAAECAVIGIGYVLLGRLARSAVLAGIGVGAFAVGAMLAVLNPGHQPALANLCIGAALVIGGLYELSREDAA